MPQIAAVHLSAYDILNVPDGTFITEIETWYERINTHRFVYLSRDVEASVLPFHPDDTSRSPSYRIWPNDHLVDVQALASVRRAR